LKNKVYIDEHDLFDFKNLICNTNFEITLKEGWKGNGIYDFEDNFISSYLEWKKWKFYLREIINSNTKK
jgi:hypothetical protein